MFFAGWPWLWFAPFDHTLQYLGRTTQRLSLPVYYAGQIWADRDVPWHYPFVMFAVTVPVGLHLLGLAGLSRLTRSLSDSTRSPVAALPASDPGTATAQRFRWPPALFRRPADPGLWLVCASLLFPLCLFAWPGVAVYDGERLFLVSFPLWAVVAGEGAAVVFGGLRHWFSVRNAALIMAVGFACNSVGLLTMRPLYLSYYNALVGGLKGADALGFELTYWGDSLTPALLKTAAERTPAGQALAVAPVLHQFQLDALLSQSPDLRRRGLQLVEFSPSEAAAGELFFLRKASLPPAAWQRLEAQLPAAEASRCETRLGVFLETTSHAPAP